MASPASASEAGGSACFAQPPPDARIHKIIHSWPDKPAAQDALITKLQKEGFGGVVCNVSFDQYLESEAKWQAFVRAVEAAKKAGMALWLYDERGYPSGNAGSITLRDHPEWEAHGLLIADAESQGQPVELSLPPGQVVLAAAFPVSAGKIDLTKPANLMAQIRDGQLQWQPPAGQWHVMVITESRLFEGTHAEGNFHAKIPYINLLMPEPTARFLEVTHEAYAKRLGDDLGKYFMATFTDEPSLMSLFLRPMPYRPLPWAPNLPVVFKQRRGYELDAALLPALVADAGPAGTKIRYDFWLTVGELVSENYFGQIQTTCRRHNVPSGGHLLMEENITAHVALYGDFFRCIRRLDAPSIDCLTSLPPTVPWYSARLLASAAELEDRPLVMCETSDHSQRYRPAGDKRPKRIVTEDEIRGTCNRLMVSGINDITSYYSFAGLSDAQMVRLNEWVGRCCTMLRGGHQVAEVAVLYPAESLWTKFVPSHRGTGEAQAAAHIESLYHATADNLFAAQRDFTFVDSRALAEAQPEAGLLIHGKLRWRVVVLPGVDTLPMAAWENLARFVRGGGVLIALGNLPLNSESEFPSARVQALGQELFGANLLERPMHANSAGGAGILLAHGSEGLLPLVLSNALEADVKVSGTKAPIRITHRHVEGREIYFVINDSASSWAGVLSFAAEGPGERWDPATGRMTEAVKADAVNLELGPYGASLFRFAAARPTKKMPVSDGALPGLVLNSTGKTTPSIQHGAKVHAEIVEDPNLSRTNAPVWRATSVLTKGQVDSYLFVSFHYAQLLDLSSADSLVLDTWVPDGQRTPNRWLVILHEEGGGDFIADTGRSLATPGQERTFISLNRFQLAGWSKDKDGVLDLKRVRDIRIGWGGYFGVEHESVQFSVALPQIGSIVTKMK